MSHRKLIYENPLSDPDDIKDFRSEGRPVMSFPKGALRLENGLDPSLGQAANFVLWCPRVMPANIIAEWEFMPLREPGLAMFWCSAHGHDGRDLFDPTLDPRDGQYRQYHSGDINAYHASYFRRKQPEERAFHTCNLRKSAGFHLVCRGPDPIPSVSDIDRFYHIRFSIVGGTITFAVDDMLCYSWHDDGVEYGPALGHGYIGFRQMAPLMAEYRNLRVFEADP